MSKAYEKWNVSQFLHCSVCAGNVGMYLILKFILGGHALWAANVFGQCI